MPSLLESRNSLLHLWTSLERKRIQPTSSPMKIGCSLNLALRHHHGFPTRQKLKHRKSILWSTTRGKKHQKNMKEFTIVSYEIHYIVTRNSKIGCTEEKCIAMDKLAQEDHSYHLPREEYLRYQKHWYLTFNKSGKNAPMKLRSDFRESSHNNEPSPPRIWRRTT